MKSHDMWPSSLNIRTQKVISIFDSNNMKQYD